MQAGFRKGRRPREHCTNSAIARKRGVAAHGEGVAVLAMVLGELLAEVHMIRLTRMALLLICVAVGRYAAGIVG